MVGFATYLLVFITSVDITAIGVVVVVKAKRFTDKLRCLVEVIKYVGVEKGEKVRECVRL